MKLRKTLALLALVAGALLVPPVALAEGWFSDLDEAKDVTLGEVVSNPRDFVDVVVRMKVYFDRTASNYNPYYTRFSDNVYGNFAAWPIDARLYQKRDFGRSYPFFFVQRMNKNWRGISSLPRIAPVEVIAVVREVFRGQPWIEVLSHRTISEGLRKDDVKAIVRGDAYMRTGKYAAAVKSYNKVDSDDAPKNVRVDIFRKRGDANFHAGNFKESVSNYRAALKLAPKSKVLEQGLAAAKDMAERKKNPEVARQRAHIVVAPAPSHLPVSDATNGVDAIIKALEDPDKVKAEVERDRLELEKRAARVRDAEAVTVSGKKEADEVEAKEAAAEGDDEVVEGSDEVVKDGVIEGEEGCGEETAAESDDPVAPVEGEKVEKENVVEEETDDGVKVEEAEGEEPKESVEETEKVEEPKDAEEGCAEESTEETEKVEEPKDAEEGCAEESTEETEKVEDPKDAEEGCAEESTEETEKVEEPKDAEEGCAEESTEETEKVEEPKDAEEGCAEESTEETEKVEEPKDVEEGCAEESTEETEEVDEPKDVEEGCAEEGCSEEVDESQEAEEVVEEKTDEAEETVEEAKTALVKDNEVREGETLVQNGVPVVPATEETDEGDTVEEAVEETPDGCGDEVTEEVEEADEATEGCGETVEEEKAEEVKKEEPRVTFSFADEDVKKVISVIASFSGANIIVSPEVKGNVSVNIKDVTWRDALEQIVKTLGYEVVEENDVLRVQPAKKADEADEEQPADAENDNEEGNEGCADENVEEGCAEESAEETEEVDEPKDAEEGCAEESAEETEEVDEPKDVEEGCAEESTEETEEVDEPKDAEEGCAEESAEETEKVEEPKDAEEGCSEEAAEDQEVEEVVEEAKDAATEDVVVKDGEVVEDVATETEGEETEDVVVEEGEVEVEKETVVEAKPVRKTVEVLPRLPFFGCDNVTEAELRAIIEEVLNNPEF